LPLNHLENYALQDKRLKMNLHPGIFQPHTDR